VKRDNNAVTQIGKRRMETLKATWGRGDLRDSYVLVLEIDSSVLTS
tara:strand:- start:23 stop:160 length:138 start_codon:yes stop_codon:yes gene_type:complete